MKKKKNKKWYKLDNAAKIFPPTSSKKDPKTFRFSVSLKEDIDCKILKKALDITLKDFPIFTSILKKGVFWYYLEESDIEANPVLENAPICDFMKEGSLLFKVMYYKKRISIEVSHALTDGTGTLSFFKSLTANYLEIKHNISDTVIVDTSSTSEKNSDSFSKYYHSKIKLGSDHKEKAYNINYNCYPENRIKVIEGLMSCKEVLKLAKKHDTTLTIYLTSLLIESIALNMSIKERKKTIYITVPVNLRKYFLSDTVRNFFSTISVAYKYSENTTLDDIIKSVAEQFKHNLTKEELDKKMNSLALLENIFIIRLVPRRIKDLVLKIAGYLSKKSHTMTFSNVGVINMPEIFKEYIEYFDVFASTDGISGCMCSYRDGLVISFTSHFINTEIEKNFFRKLATQGIDITINSNVVEEEDINEEVL